MRGDNLTTTNFGTCLIGSIAAAMMATAAGAEGTPMRVAMGDIASVETLGLLIAMERTRERGVPMDITFFNSEDVATQAVVGGQADIGVGAPYAFIQNSKAPIRMFYRMSTLQFFPVVNTEFYQDWQDLDGQEVTVHSRGSGTEALMRLMEAQHDISYSAISYVPGSEVRAGAMLQGAVKATIVDSSGFRLLTEQGKGRFERLPLDGVNATDEALYGNADFLDDREADVEVFIEELSRTWTEINDDPTIVAELRTRYDLLPDLPEQAVAGITPYFEGAVNDGMLPTRATAPEDVMDDLRFLSAAGQVETPGPDTDPSAFWDLDLLTAAAD
ncbi:ABC transporter substrate-binding protein [Paracoccus sp. 1_MG-2023]|uniref:ABC transporter substrate-binding protein n=1 Tax=unclassified Paracoccus (in: a-proteobacteria) TaxID=2688777 RepID=UPI001C0848F1|nr:MULTISPECIES: ABC transporter substrate-binding protein [unclassified Paracoccus (in: a-proteobacteria)]MBU2957863.1 ABC transporter substrate-binding protein [Paracoccus sp. C2R09]MDO6668945.1 ABC transporter substrate-binding protein [Paracoccus sp. 1_MG-2023]